MTSDEFVKSLSAPLECFSRTYLIVMICLPSFSIRCFQYTTKCNKYYYIYQEFLAAASALKHANLIVYLMRVTTGCIKKSRPFQIQISHHVLYYLIEVSRSSAKHRQNIGKTSAKPINRLVFSQSAIGRY